MITAPDIEEQRSIGGHSRMLSKLGLARNPFVDRTAEKTSLLDGSFYLHSDLQGYKPNKTTYIFFGRRGSGKTTIRLMMMQRHFEYNEAQLAAGKPQLLVVDLCRPGRLSNCLKSFMEKIGAQADNWDARFCEEWKSDDLADCIVSFAVEDMVRNIMDQTDAGKMIVSRLRQRPRSASQFLLLCHLYAREDSTTLAQMRNLITPGVNLGSGAWRWTAGLVGGALGVGGIVAAVSAAGGDSSELFSSVWKSFAGALGFGSSSNPFVSYPKTSLLAAVASGLGFWRFMQRRASNKTDGRARDLCAPVRIADTRQEVVSVLLDRLFSPDDSADVIRRLYIGNTAQQKLEFLNVLAEESGFQGVSVFGDCFDEVNLLDPLAYPASLKTFAREVCRNEILNIGRLHFFFPDARASLDLSTDRVVREARFDRHFVRDLTWSRFQLEDLAERRFMAAQQENMSSAGQKGKQTPSFSSLFQHVKKEDFSASISKLHTPRELMVFMTELMARIEAHAAENGTMVAAQDMEIAVTKAQEQSV